MWFVCIYLETIYIVSRHFLFLFRMFLMFTLYSNCVLVYSSLLCYIMCVGTAVVTETKAALWTDGRYHLQASSQIDDNWLLMKDGAS